MQSFSLAQIAEHLGAQLIGDGAVNITRIASLDKAQSNEVSFLSQKKYRKQLEMTQAAAVILTQEDSEYFTGTKLIVANPYVAYAKLAQFMDTTPVAAHTGIHPSAVIEPSANISPLANIGANVVIEAGAVVGDYVQIGAGSFIGRCAIIGTNTKIWANVTIYHDVVIGQNCVFHSGAVIGSDGFGFANERGQWVKIPQVGSVVIGDQVEIGANTAIDRGAIENTEIHSNVIIDNMVHLAHNVIIGEGTAIAACSVIAGSTTIGKYCQIAGLCGINGHIDVCDGVIFTGMTMVTKSVTEPGVYSSGLPHSSNKEWRKQIAQFRHLGDMNQKIKQLEAFKATMQADDK